MSPGPDESAGPRWEPLFAGIRYWHLERNEPLPLALHAVRIDLTEDGVRFVTTPANGDAPRETNSLRVSAFLVAQQCQLAINASPFSPVSEEEGVPQDIIGLSISDGVLVSKPHPKYAALIITKDGHANIVTPPYPTDDIVAGVGGFTQILHDGNRLGEQEERHPRTAAGVSKDGRTLYLAVIDGRQLGHSLGATTAETAEWMQWLGADDAINLDGGGSTALVVQDLQHGYRLLNKPIHKGLVGKERYVGNCLGVVARPLDAPKPTDPE